MKNKETCIRVLADANQINACKKLLQNNQIIFAGLSNILALTGNEVRLKILFLFEEEGELCPCDLADILGMSIPAISQHLRKMKDGRIIKARKVAQTIFYSIEPAQLKLLKPLFTHIIESTQNSVQL